MTYTEALAAIVPLVGKSVTVMVTATTGMPIAFIEGTLTRGVSHGFARHPFSSEHLYFTVASGEDGSESRFYISEADFCGSKWKDTPESSLALMFKSFDVHTGP